MRRTPVIVMSLLGMLLIYLVFWPVPIDGEAWVPDPPPSAEGVWAPNRALAQVERFPVAPDTGPEDVAVDAQGRRFVGTRQGRILVVHPDGSGPDEVVDLSHRPLGLHHAADGRLLVAVPRTGLVAVESDGSTEVLCDAADGVPLDYADDLDVAADGTVYVSDASTKFSHDRWTFDILESAPNGRLVAWSPEEGCRQVADGLHFANGVAMGADDRSVLVVETSRYRVVRVWVEGPTPGAVQAFAGGFPGFPDGIARADDGTYWVALASPRSAILDRLAPYPALRHMILRLPAFLRPAPGRRPRVVHLSATGEVLEVLDDPQGERFGMVTSVQPHGPWLYLGSLSEPAFARVRRP